jgi:hypothetical protein
MGGVGMHTDRQIALWGGWIAGPAFGVAMMAAPEYLHLKPVLAAGCFWGGILVFVVTVFVVAALQSRERGEKKSMWPIFAMAAGMIVFGVGVAGFFWPDRGGKEDEGKQEVAAGELLLECQSAPLPEVGLPNQTMLFKISPFRFTELGSIGYGTTPSEPGKPIPWPSDWKNKAESSARCRLTSYSKTPLFNVEIPFKITFVLIERGENPGSTVANKTINVADGVVPITKLEPGSENAFVFYIHNQGRDIIHAQFADAATCLPLGDAERVSIKVIQPNSVIYRAASIWPGRDANEIVKEAEESAKSQAALPAQSPAPPNTLEKK